MGRIVLAFVVAPLAVPVGLLAWMLASNAPREQWVIAPVAALYTYGVSVVAGLPATYLYRTMAWTRAWQFAIGGSAIGTLAAIGIAERSVAALGFFGGLGVVAALVFWAIGVRGNAAFALPREPASTVPLPPWQLPSAADVRDAAGRARERGRALAATFRTGFASWRRPAETATGPRPPVVGVLALAVPLLTTVGTFPWLWPGMRQAIERLYTLGMIIALGYVGLVIALSGLTVILALVAVVMRERHRFWLAAAAVALAAAGLAIMRAQMS